MQVLLRRGISDDLKKEFGQKSGMILVRHPQRETHKQHQKNLLIQFWEGACERGLGSPRVSRRWGWAGQGPKGMMTAHVQGRVAGQTKSHPSHLL